MAQVDFYQLSRDPVERVVPLLAAKVLENGGRLLVVSDEAAQRAAVADALWAREGAFPANGEAGGVHDARQPILLSERCESANGAGVAIIVDGAWREEAASFERTILMFGPDQTEAARGLWRAFSGSGHTLRIFKQGDSGGWREGA